MRVYVSGGITGRPNNREEFAKACTEVEGMGHEPVDPHDIPPCSDQSCDGSWIGENDLGPVYWDHTWSCYLRNDLIELLRCDGIYMMKTWQSSHGARLELQVAAAAGLEVIWQ